MKTYTDEEINSLLEELRTDLPQLLKSEGGKRHPSAESGGQESKGKEVGGKGSEGQIDNGGPGGPKGTDGNHGLNEGQGKPEKNKGNKGLNKEAENMEGSLEKEGSAPEGSPAEASPAGEPESAPEGLDEGPAEGEGAPEEAPAEPEQAGGDEQTLEEAYASLPEDQLRMHYEALRAVVMSRMGGGQDQGMAPEAPMGPEQGAAPEAPMAPEAPAEPEQPMQMSEAPNWAEELQKATDEKVANLEKQLAGVTQLLEMMVTRPTQKAFTSMAQFVAKSELDKPVAPRMNRKEVIAKLAQVAQSDLKKSDRDLINRYTLNGDVDVKDIAHLLK